jgi:hypothetical protein
MRDGCRIQVPSCPTSKRYAGSASVRKMMQFCTARLVVVVYVDNIKLIVCVDNIG